MKKSLIALALMVAPIVLTGCEGEKPAPAPAGGAPAAAPSAPGKETPKDTAPAKPASAK